MAGLRIFAFAQQKGGTGKTVSVCWLAWLLSRDHRVAVIDLDPQGAATALLGSTALYQHGAYDLIVGGDIPKDAVVRSKFSNCMLVPATDALIMAEMDARVQSLDFDSVRKRMEKAFQSFDYILIDCGSGLGILTSLAMSISETVIMPLPEGELENRALNATYRHLSRMRRDAADIAVALPVMRRQTNAVGMFESDAKIALSSVIVPYDDGILHSLQGLTGSSEPDTSDPMIAAYFALAHELEGHEWQTIVEPEHKARDDQSDPEPSEALPTRAPSRRVSEPPAETMTDIFDALHEKRSKQPEEIREPQETKPSTPSRPIIEPPSAQISSALPPNTSAMPAPNSAPPTYQSLRDIHHDTLEVAPKIKTWFWLRLGLSFIGIGVAIIGIFTNLIGPVAMWGAVIAVLILIVPDLILRFVLRDR